MAEDTLYEQDDLKITYLHSPESGKEKDVVSGEDHELWLKNRDNEWCRYIIQRGILKELAETSKIIHHTSEDSSNLIRLLNKISPSIWFSLKVKGITLEEISKAFIAAHQKEEEDFEKYLIAQKNTKEPTNSEDIQTK